MAQVGRLAGALLAKTEERFYLIGQLKMPCAWAEHGFECPAEEPSLKNPWVQLIQHAPTRIATPYLELVLEGEALAQKLADLFVIERTGLVSERLWRLVIGLDESNGEPPKAVTKAQWLTEIPPPIWHIVRETVLRCS